MTLPSAGRGALAALLLLLVVGCSGSEEKAAPEDPTAKVKVELGKEFTWNDFTVADGWKLKPTTRTINMEEVEQTDLLGDVTNDAAETRFALFEFIFVAGNEIQSTIRCSTAEKISSGTSAPLLCPGFGQAVPAEYDLIQVQQITR